MRQLLIVNSSKALNAKRDGSGSYATPYDLSNLAEGAICFYECDASSLLSAAATKNFAIALGRKGNSPAFLIPEVDIATLEITKTLPRLGNAFTTTFTFPTPVKGKEYTVIVRKLGTVLNERASWTTSIVAGSTTAATEAAALIAAINNKTNNEFNVTASASSAAVTIAGNVVGEGWQVILADNLEGVSQSATPAKKTIGDKAFLVDLASRCAAGKGFNLLSDDGKDIYPGYPEAVEDLVPNNATHGSSTTGYAIYNLHFATKRANGKQLNELVWQYVHIAVPVNNASADTIAAILPEGNFMEVKVNGAVTTAANAAAASGGTGGGSNAGGGTGG